MCIHLTAQGDHAVVDGNLNIRGVDGRYGVEALHQIGFQFCVSSHLFSPLEAFNGDSAARKFFEDSQLRKYTEK
jgi:hypothetical protein